MRDRLEEVFGCILDETGTYHCPPEETEESEEEEESSEDK